MFVWHWAQRAHNSEWDKSNTKYSQKRASDQSYTCFACMFMYLLQSMRPSSSLVPIQAWEASTVNRTIPEEARKQTGLFILALLPIYSFNSLPRLDLIVYLYSLGEWFWVILSLFRRCYYNAICISNWILPILLHGYLNINYFDLCLTTV